MEHPRRAARDPLKGAMLAARQSRFRGILGSVISLASVSLYSALLFGVTTDEREKFSYV